MVSNYDDLKAFIIGMTQKGPLGSSEKVCRITDGTPQYGGPLQFDNSLHMVQQTSAWSSNIPPLTWSLSPPQFGTDRVFATLVNDGPCSYLQINVIDESEAYGPTGEWILAAFLTANCTPALADAKDRIPVCTNCDTGGGLFPRPLRGQPHNPPFCDQRCCMCKHPPDSHAEHCIRYKGWLHTCHPERLPPKQPRQQVDKSAHASSSTSAIRRPFRRSCKEISRRLTIYEGAVLATVVGSQSQLMVMAADDNPEHRALAEDLAAHNVAHHDELFHIIEHTDPTHRAQSDQMEFASGTSRQSSAQNNARACIIERSSNPHMPVWRAAVDMVSTSSESITAAKVLGRIKAIQDQFRDELIHMQHDEWRCKKLQWYLDHAVQLHRGVESGVFTSQEALDEIHAIKVHTDC